MRSFLAFAVLLVPSYAVAQGLLAPAKLGTHVEVREGMVSDIAGSRFDYGFADQRFWLAQGTVRTAFHHGTRTRVHAEDATYTTLGPAGAKEFVVALEFDDSSGRLYTLTDSALYREDTAPPASPAAPANRVFLSFRHDANFPASYRLEPGEQFQDMRIWSAGGSTRILLLTTHRILSIADQGAGGLVLGSASAWSTAMYPPSTHATIDDTTNDSAFNSLDVYRFFRFDLFQEAASAPLANHLIAAVLANTRGYFGGQSTREQPVVVLLCDLGTAATATPTFDCDPGASINYAYHLSAPFFPGGGGFNIDAFNVGCLDAFADPASNYRGLYVGGNQTFVPPLFTLLQTPAVREVDVGGKLPIPSGAPGQTPGRLPMAIGHALTEPGQPGVLRNVPGGLPVINILAEDVNPRGRIFVPTREGFYVHLPLATQPYSSVTNDQPLGKGAQRDLLRTQQATADPAYEIVILPLHGSVDHALKTVDVTAAVPPVTGIPLANFNGGVYSMSSSDGGVIVPHTYTPSGGGSPFVRDDVYVPTFGGVVKFDPDAGLNYRSSASSFQPAVAVGQANFQTRVTEHIDFGRVGSQSSSNRDFLFTASGTGDFLAYRTDELAAYRVLPGASCVPSSPLLATLYGWTYPGNSANGQAYYGNDIHFADLQPASEAGGKWVVTDITRQVPQTGEWHVALLGYAWDVANQEWRHLASTSLATQADAATDRTLTTTITLSPDKNAFVVSHHSGFFTVRQQLATNSLPVVSTIATTLAGQTAKVHALTATNTRIFAFVGSDGVAPSEIRVYAWDSTTGIVQTTPLSTLLATQINSPLLPPLVRAFRARFDPATTTDPTNPTLGDVYIACDSGVLLKFLWSGGNTVQWTGWWRSDYSQPMQDCRIYSLQGVAGNPKAILAVKDTEGFALVKTVP